MEVDLKHEARTIVSQLFDLAGVPVEKRQEINDKCDLFVLKMLIRMRIDAVKDHHRQDKQTFTPPVYDDAYFKAMGQDWNDDDY